MLYEHINSWIPAPCFAKASQGIGYEMQGLGQAAEVLYKHISSAVLQAAEDPSEITLRYLTGQAD